VEDPLEDNKILHSGEGVEDNKILHSGEGGDVER